MDEHMENDKSNESKGPVPIPDDLLLNRSYNLPVNSYNYETSFSKPDNISNIKNLADWLKSVGWDHNPFTFDITPLLFVGYNDQKNAVLRKIQDGHKIILIIGPTGSGKTTFMKWLHGHFNTVYVAKPPDSAEMFVDIFNDELSPKGVFARLKRLFIPNIKNIYQIPRFLNHKMKGKKLVLLIDEVHEANHNVLEWMRVLSDQIDNMCLVISGLPVFENKLDDLETMRKRISERIELLSLTKEESRELISKRIQNAGGLGNEFDSVFDLIYERTHGFPREIIRLCNNIIDEAVRKGEVLIMPKMLRFDIKKEMPTTAVLDNLTPMQRRVLDLLKRPMTPGQIADAMDLSKYKSRQHCVRSVNNILKMLMKDAFVERSKEEKAFLYFLAPRIKTLLVSA